MNPNRSVLHTAKNPIMNEKTEHVEVDCNFTREIVTTNFIHIESQLVDLPVKAIGKSNFKNHFTR